MADQIANVAASGVSPFSVLNVLPTKRIDAAITAAAESGIPEQGEQIGGYSPAYVHLSHLPLLPLYSQAQDRFRGLLQSNKEMHVKGMDACDPDKLLSGSQRTVLNIMSLLSGGAGVVGMKRWERRLEGANVISAQKSMEQNQLVIFTRWTIPIGQGTPWFVDVVEQQLINPLTKSVGHAVTIKAGFPPSNTRKENKITLKLLNMDLKGIKSQKPWTKNAGPCEAIIFIGDDSQEVRMEIVARIQRPCSAMEAYEVGKRFRKQWLVPVLQ